MLTYNSSAAEDISVEGVEKNMSFTIEKIMNRNGRHGKTFEVTIDPNLGNI